MKKIKKLLAVFAAVSVALMLPLQTMAAVYARDIFPLTEEIESVEWMPGLIALLPDNEIKNTEMFEKNIPVFQFNFPIVSDQTSQCFKEALAASEKRGEVLFPYLFYPFDFTSMQPVAGTRHRLLR